MRNSIKLLGGLLMSSLLAQSANAVNVSVTAGQADFEMTYALNTDNINAAGKTKDAFNYYNLGVSIDRGEYTYGANLTGLLEQGVSEFDTNSGEYLGEYDASRSSYSLSVARALSENLSVSVGYYSAQFLMAGDVASEDDETNTEALFASLTYSDRLNDKMFWYGRIGAQLNEAEIIVQTKNHGVLSEKLDGDAIVLGAGIVYPLSDTANLIFGLEHKDFNYSGTTWDLSESQTLSTVGYSFQF
tara:strand:- start:1386 stop:2117 length:732 start_codon:yes stop_codon:yes gene_type:complete